VTQNLIILSLGGAVTVRQSLPFPVRLSFPAPPGGVDVALVSSDPTLVRVETPTVTIPEGSDRANGSIVGVKAGTATITGRNPNYASDQTDIEVSAALALTPNPLHTLSGIPQPLAITFLHQDLPQTAPPGGIDV